MNSLAELNEEISRLHRLLSEANMQAERDARRADKNAADFAALQQRVEALTKERDEARTVLEAWQTSFGSSQLSHAIAHVEADKRALANATRQNEATQATGNALYGAIVTRLEPYYPKGSRDLEWDVLPSTLEALARQNEELKVNCARWEQMYRSARIDVDSYDAMCVRIWSALGDLDPDKMHDIPCDVQLANRLTAALAQVEQLKARVAELEGESPPAPR